MVDEVIPVATRRWRSQLLTAATWSEIGALRRLRGALRYRGRHAGPDPLRAASRAWPAGVHHGYDGGHSIREPLASRLYDVTHTRLARPARGRRNRKLHRARARLHLRRHDRLRPAARVRAQGGCALCRAAARDLRAEKEWPRKTGSPSAAICVRLAVLRRAAMGQCGRGERAANVSSAPSRTASVLPRQSLDATAKVIAEAALVVGVDTGLLHLAAAYSVPLVGIHVATAPAAPARSAPALIEVIGGKGTPPSSDEVLAAAAKVLRGLVVVVRARSVVLILMSDRRSLGVIRGACNAHERGRSMHFLPQTHSRKAASGMALASRFRYDSEGADVNSHVEVRSCWTTVRSTCALSPRELSAILKNVSRGEWS